MTTTTILAETDTTTITPELLRKLNSYWRAANYVSVGQIYLFDNPLLRERALGNLVNTPILIRHDEADSPPIQESVAFVSRAKVAGANATLDRVQGGIHGVYQNPMGEKRSMFEFFRGKQLSSAARKASVESPRFRQGRGPIEDAFGAPILVVEGTRGTGAQRAAVHDLVEAFRSEWRKAYFVDCPTKRDADISADDIDKYNLWRQNHELGH